MNGRMVAYRGQYNLQHALWHRPWMLQWLGGSWGM
jgi:hypothetical protein